MVTIEEGRSKQATAEKQVGTAFLCVIAHQGHGTGDDGQQNRDGLKQGVEFGVADPGGTVQRETDEKKNYAKRDIDQASLHASIWPESHHSERLSAGRYWGISGFGLEIPRDSRCSIQAASVRAVGSETKTSGKRASQVLLGL